MLNVQNLIPVEWSNRRVLTTAQLADAYKCSVDQIKVNFNANKTRYKEGLHYFKIAGKELNELRVRNPYLQISPMTRTLYLWTEQGAVRHCKSINTSEAWSVFDDLEENYFNPKLPVITAPVAKREPNPRRVAGQFTDACVYVALMSDGTVKIGQSHNVRRRLSDIKSQYKLSVVKHYCTPLMSREVARLIEQSCHEIFSSSKVDGEFFCVEFENACSIIDSFVKFSAKLGESKVAVISTKLIADKKFD